TTISCFSARTLAAAPPQEPGKGSDDPVCPSSSSNPATSRLQLYLRRGKEEISSDGEGEAGVHLHQARVGRRHGVLLREAQEPSPDHGEARVQEVRPPRQQARPLHGGQDEVSARVFAGRWNNAVEPCNEPERERETSVLVPCYFFLACTVDGLSCGAVQLICFFLPLIQVRCIPIHEAAGPGPCCCTVAVFSPSLTSFRQI
uniref:Uncharacterized protein n=1 Tax=Triticum urartu TaxID=4572 RepID=A0A8R7V8Y3_TRIUA